jgi:membrane-bound lytic murein transglycosylase A
VPRRFVALLSFLILVIAVLAIAVWVVLEEAKEPGLEPPRVELPPEPPPEPELALEPAGFEDLPGWTEDDLGEALPALLASCRVFARRALEEPIGPDGLAGRAGDWREPCAAVARLAEPGADPGAPSLRLLLEERFRPWEATNRGDPEGLFTGYYEPSLRGSRRRQGAYRTPLHTRPRDLVEVDLGEFREDLSGRRIAGRVEDGRLRPYADRSGIEGGALAGRSLELVWVDDPVDAFFLQIQGSGRVELEDGSVVRLGYAAQNGHPYTAIGRELVDRGEMALEEVSMQSIRAWLEAHPEEAREVMAANASYVFFRVLEGPGPLGSLGVPLTPGRSLAVDAGFLPLGAPLWLDAAAPHVPAGAAEPAGERPLRRLVAAQDTGGAIRGPVRGDVFWGPGERAEILAGYMKHPGRLWLLLPREVDPQAAGDSSSGRTSSRR